jgi:hypothetical protein
VATELAEVRNVEECEGGWLAASWDSNAFEFVSGDDSSGEPPADGVGRPSRPRLGISGRVDGELMYPSAVSLIPGLGLVVLELGNDGRVQFFTSPDAIAMDSMSPHRVGWIAAVVRAAAWRRR